MDFKQRMALANELVGLLKTLSDKSIPTIERIDSSKRRIEILKELKAKAEATQNSGTITLEEFKLMTKKERISALEAALKYPNWYEYEMVFEPDHSSILEKGKDYVVYRSRLGVEFGYRGYIARDLSYWEKDAGKSSVNGGAGSWSRGNRSKAIKLIKKYSSEIDAAESDKPLTLADKFVKGYYHKVEYSAFRKILLLVNDMLSLNDIKAGVIGWYEYNQGDLRAEGLLNDLE